MSPNTQTPTPSAQLGDRILVHSIFPTIQGEGPYAGNMAVFIRLYGCNLQCPWCDTDYTSKSEAFTLDLSQQGLPTLGEISRRVRKLTPIRQQIALGQKQLVVITGGEPFRQNLNPLLQELVEGGFIVQVETNGTLWPSDCNVPEKVCIVCSPKTPKIHPELAARANCYKYVLDADHIDPADGLPAGTLGKYGNTARPPNGWLGEIFVQPLDEQDVIKNSRNLEACVTSVLRYGYRLCIQTHKLANVP